MESGHILVIVIVALIYLPEILAVILKRGGYDNSEVEELKQRVEELEKPRPPVTKAVERS